LIKILLTCKTSSEILLGREPVKSISARPGLADCVFLDLRNAITKAAEIEFGLNRVELLTVSNTHTESSSAIRIGSD
jgi:hypothetical protein